MSEPVIQHFVRLASPIYKMPEFLTNWISEDILVTSSYDIYAIEDSNKCLPKVAICSINGTNIQDYQVIDEVNSNRFYNTQLVLAQTQTMSIFRGIALRATQSYCVNINNKTINFKLTNELEIISK
ncbi:MAG: hypothetical protein AAFQ80_15150 [Cyanobacteria bacterium J06621_8]